MVEIAWRRCAPSWLHYHEGWPLLPDRLLLLQLFMRLEHLAQVVQGRKHCVLGIIPKPGNCATEK